MTGALVTAGAALALAGNNVVLPAVYASGANAPTVVLLRYGFFIVALVAVIAATRRSFVLPPGRTAHALGSGIATATGSLGLLAAFAVIPVNLAVIIIYLYPILTTVLTSLFSRTLPTFGQFSFLVLALAGVGLAVGVDRIALDPRGIAFALIGAVGFAASFAWSGLQLRDVDSTVASLYLSSAGLLVCVAAVASGTGFVPPTGSPGWVGFAVATAAFSIAFLGMYKGISLIGGARAAMLMNLEPVLTIGLAALLLGEQLTPPRLAGSGLVILAVLGSQLLAMRAERAPSYSAAAASGGSNSRRSDWGET